MLSDPIKVAIRQIKSAVPLQILNYAFVYDLFGTQGNMVNAVSIDTLLQQRVIEDRVFEDINLKGGITDKIDLTGLPYEQTNVYTRVYRIPKWLTGNRRIAVPLNIVYGSSGVAGMPYPYAGAGSAMYEAANQVVNAMSPIAVPGTANVHLIAENTILIRDYLSNYGNIWLECVFEYDSRLSSLQPRSYQTFAQLCVLACKSYIYTNTIVRMDEGVVIGGYQIGAFKNIIDQYSDAEEKYNEMLEKDWSKVAVFNDPQEFVKHLRRITGNS